MIAKIVDKDKREYYSAVFAICGNGFDTAVIVYDDEKSRFSFIKMYGFTKDLVRSVFLIDNDKKDFINSKPIRIGFCKIVRNIRGYDWLVENDRLFIDILKNKQVDEGYREKAEKINKGISIKEWNLVKNGHDVENLMTTAWDFHDARIDKIIYKCENDSTEILFSGCWGCKIILRFQSNLTVHYSDYEFAEIMDSNVFFENGYVFWVDNYKIKSEEELNVSKYATYFKGRFLFWKTETEYNVKYDEEDDDF